MFLVQNLPGCLFSHTSLCPSAVRHRHHQPLARCTLHRNSTLHHCLHRRWRNCSCSCSCSVPLSPLRCTPACTPHARPHLLSRAAPLCPSSSQPHSLGRRGVASTWVRRPIPSCCRQSHSQPHATSTQRNAFPSSSASLNHHRAASCHCSPLHPRLTLFVCALLSHDPPPCAVDSTASDPLHRSRVDEAGTS